MAQPAQLPASSGQGNVARHSRNRNLGQWAIVLLPVLSSLQQQQQASVDSTEQVSAH
jgi:hypothetical protein